MANHIVEVTLQGGQVVCVPDEIHVREGDKIVWAGLPHQGHFMGKLKQPHKPGGFAKADLGPDKREPMPDDTGLLNGWQGAQVMTIRRGAKRGAYPYVVKVTHNGKDIESDPVVIIED